MERLNAGTKEIVSVVLTDRLGTITDLSSYAGDFKVTDHSGTTVVQDWTAVTTITGMRVDCLVNTVGWDKGRYRLLVRITVGAELPIIGPFDFDLI